MNRHEWRRFRPRRFKHPGSAKGLFEDGRLIAERLLAKNHGLLEAAVEEVATRIKEEPTSHLLLASLLLQLPIAARAQAQMDKHPYGYHDKQARLYQLIDFNDTFVATVLALDEPAVHDFIERFKKVGTDFCRQLKYHMLTDEQYDAITHGLSREIAVFRGALKAGFQAELTSRNEDAFGIDMRIADGSLGRFINVDVKTASAFHFRLSELVREGRLHPSDQVDAEAKGYWEVVNNHDNRHVKIILLRISDEELGRIIDFSFVEPERFAKRLHRIIAERSQAFH
ncbi:MAG: hypothetical protein ACSLEY_02045 [Candidatus Saccharimonadales bacterium]